MEDEIILHFTSKRAIPKILFEYIFSNKENFTGYRTDFNEHFQKEKILTEDSNPKTKNKNKKKERKLFTSKRDYVNVHPVNRKIIVSEYCLCVE